MLTYIRRNNIHMTQNIFFFQAKYFVSKLNEIRKIIFQNRVIHQVNFVLHKWYIERITLEVTKAMLSY